ncbi:hypothetical protein EDC04DRAFT_2631543 [Pisolithus marmoratus]|nr:hypothetical protein EDC04DRAFT_2631543 [Pisolithus marmoratus]
MLRHCARLQLRRCLHTRASPSFNAQTFKRYGHPAYVVGASLTMATYLAWVWNLNPWHVSLDSEPVQDSQTRHPPSKLRPSPSSEHAPSASTTSEMASTEETGTDATPLDVQDKEENQEDSSGGEGAFNPETGEINWDCPCLGGMAHGPCGSEFREAFSCFVYSDKDPKGIDCVEKFKAMQDCFRAHPDIYGEEIMDDEDENVETSSEAFIQPEHVPSSNSPSPKDKEQPAPPAQTP